MNIDCPSWRDVGQRDFGVCVKGYFGGRPSKGICIAHCPDYPGTQRMPELHAYLGVTVDPKAKHPKPRWQDYAAAETSLLTQGPVPLPIYEHRKQCCTGSPCAHLKKDDSDPIGYCGSCGCGKRERARLSTKLHMPKATCPKGVWGEARGEGLRHLRRIGGLVKQVNEIIAGIRAELKGANDGDQGLGGN